MYKYHSVQELAQLLEQHWHNTDEFQLEWKLDGENDQLIHFKIKAHDETVLETTCDIYTIEIHTYNLDKDVQEWFRDPWYDNYTRADIELPTENGRDIELGDTVAISDPCYDHLPWCCGILENVKPGTWHTKTENQTSTAGVTVVQRSLFGMKVLKNPMKMILKKTDINIGVDSGQAGIYDYNHFKYIKSDTTRDE